MKKLLLILMSVLLTGNDTILITERSKEGRVENEATIFTAKKLLNVVELGEERNQQITAPNLFVETAKQNNEIGYISAPLEYVEYETGSYVIQNLEVIEFKSGLKLEQCLTTSLSSQNIILICTATNLKNIYIPLKESLIFDGKIFPQNSYIIAIDIDYGKIIKDIGGRK